MYERKTRTRRPRSVSVSERAVVQVRVTGAYAPSTADRCRRRRARHLNVPEPFRSAKTDCECHYAVWRDNMNVQTPDPEP